jgi:hypothetical protein
MMWNRFKDKIEQQGGVVRLNCNVEKILRTGNHIDRVMVSCDGKEEMVEGSDFISSMPVTEFIKKLDTPPPRSVSEAAENLHFRAFLTVCLIVNKPHLFEDNWIYVHDPEVKVGRIQNFKNWSPYMVPDGTKTSLGLEYFCTEGDALWNSPDADLIELGKRETENLALLSQADVEDGCVYRLSHAYPVYDSGHSGKLSAVRDFVGSMVNFQTIGRNGLHRYNNQDHAMLTGMLAVRNLVDGEKNDLWNVNADQEYHEELLRGEGVEEQKALEALQGTFARVFMKLDRVALGLSLGMVSGTLLFLATLWLVLKGGEFVGWNLQLLSQYFPGYTVTLWGSVLGFTYGFASGFIGGWLFAFLRNAAMLLYLMGILRGAQRVLLWRLFDYL